MNWNFLLIWTETASIKIQIFVFFLFVFLFVIFVFVRCWILNFGFSVFYTSETVSKLSLCGNAYYNTTFYKYVMHCLETQYIFFTVYIKYVMYITNIFTETTSLYCRVRQTLVEAQNLPNSGLCTWRVYSLAEQFKLKILHANTGTQNRYI